MLVSCSVELSSAVLLTLRCIISIVLPTQYFIHFSLFLGVLLAFRVGNTLCRIKEVTLDRPG